MRKKAWRHEESVEGLKKTNSKLLSSANYSMTLCLSESHNTGTGFNRPHIGLIY